MRDLKGKVVVVTGAASGIGRECAVAFAKQGCELALCDINMAELEVTKSLSEAQGATVSVRQVDVADRSQMTSFADAVVQTHGAAHVVVNNAGVTIMADFEEQSIEEMEWILGINLWGVIYGCKLFLPHLKAAGEGHFVNISSAFGIIAPPKQTTYVASKFAVRGFSASLRGELAAQNIGVTSVHPGAIQTNIVRDAKGVETDKVRARTQSGFDRFGTSPSVVANKIVRAVQRNSPRVLVTAETYLADTLKRVAPNATDRLVHKLSTRMSD